MLRSAPLLLGVLALPYPAVLATEPWADPSLPAKQGLVLWLDASRQPAAWQAHQKPPLTNGVRIDVCYDGSGAGRHFRQGFQPSQPRFLQAGSGAALRFDGTDDCLTSTRQNLTLETFTVFLVAAPRSNPGVFRGFFAANETGQRDYTHGFTIDMTWTGSPVLDRINVEGKGFQGAVNLMRTALPFGAFQTIEIHSKPGSDGIALFVNGQQQGRRERKPGNLRVDDLTLGARFYTNSADPPFLQGFLDGDIAEVLLYDRLLPESESNAVRDYLQRKHADLSQALTTNRLLRSVANPPAVQMFVPGFIVKRLPLDLPNINNIRYRPDGKLVALAYNGDVYALSDTDGDGVEDKAELFWDNQGRIQAPIGMALTPPGYRHGNGLFTPSKGKLSLIVDSNGDGKADKEIIVAQGWKALAHGVDALGVALARDGSIYFGIGTADFTNAYQVDAKGQASYDLKSERGTILKLSPDFSKREIVATGIRFPVGMAFDRNGELFASDQEGATWLANGNPLDELLHIERGRHYGFPPRHPKHLPGVIDEPSVFDYAPQHQSTCGLFFNDPTFGPAWWKDDALVTGYSRGKLFRTKLARTPSGYVAQNQVFAGLKMLAIDACVSPKGELVVAVHSGAPDWGTGPAGKGKLYKIVYRDGPQSVLAWSAGPHEVRIAFDRPLTPEQLRELSREVSVEYGAAVRPGDRFESLRPGYAVVAQQLAAPRKALAVQAVQVTSDRQTLVLLTAPQNEAATYAVTLPGMTRTKPVPGELPQVSAIDLGYDLTGVSATWQAAKSDAVWSGWLPHADLTVARTFTTASAEHERVWKLIEQPGTLNLRMQLDLWQMLRPAVQPGSQLDFTLPPEEVTVTFSANGPLELKTPARHESTTDKNGRHLIKLHVQPREKELLPVEIMLRTNGKTPALDVSWFTKEDARPRALPLRRILLPWATTQPQPSVLKRPTELAGGDWSRGRAVFFSEQAQCAKCHQLRGQGGKIGADLSNLIHRDYDSVLRDIRQPSAAVNPDHLAFVVELKDGRVLTGAMRSDGDRIILGDRDGKETVVSRAQIATATPSPISIMPEGLDKTLGPDKLRDLLTFLLTEPLSSAPLEAAGAPPPRRWAEVEAALKGSTSSSAPRKKMHVVLASGPKDHGPGEHDYPLWQRRWLNLLGLAGEVRVSEANGWPTAEQFSTADVIVFYSANAGWSGARAAELDAYLERGGGLVYLHYAVNGDIKLADRLGLAWIGGQARFRHGPVELTFTDPKHPITRGFDRLRFIDESYWRLSGDPKNIHLLASGVEEGEPRPLLWTHEKGKGRVFVSILGHYTWTFDDPLFRILILRALAWTAREPVDRLIDLATIGARIE